MQGPSDEPERSEAALQWASRYALVGRRALVVGASRGIGRATAATLAATGAQVAVAARTRSALDEVVSELTETMGHDPVTVVTDVRELDSIDRAFEEAAVALGGLDIVCVFAGTSTRAPISDMTEAMFDEVIDTNLKGSYFCARAAARYFLPQAHGKLVLVGSLASRFGFNLTSHYVASKGGVAQLTRSLAVEWAEANVQVNAVAPGFVETTMTAPSLAIPERRAWILSRTPAHRFGRPEEIANVVTFLCSPAADFITGQILFVDGGFSAGSQW